MRPARERIQELIGVDGGEHAPDGVVAGDTFGEFEEAPEPLLAGFRKLGHHGEVAVPAEHAAQADGEDIAELVMFGSIYPWVFDAG